MDITQVPAGYKLTDLGVLPEEWEVKTLRQVLKGAKLGGNYANSEAYSPKPLIKMGNMKRGSISLHKVEYITGQQDKVDSKHRLVYGDLLFNTRNTLDLVGKISIWRDELPVAYYNSNILRFDFDPIQIASSFFVNHIVNTEDAVNRMRGLATGTTSVAAIYTRDLLNFQIPVPPLLEQQAIADALGEMDALLTAQRVRLAKQWAVKQGLLQGLLSGKQRLPGFSGEWEVKRLGDIAAIDSDNLTARTPVNYEFDYISLEDANSGVLNGTTRYKFSEAPSRARRRVQKDDVLVATVRPNLKSHLYINWEAAHLVCSTGFAVIRCYSDKAVPQFIYSNFFGESINQQIDTLIGGSNYPAISNRDVKNLSVDLPPIEEQRAIAAVLSEADAYLAALEAEHAKTQLLKQGMMQNLLTGKLRLV